MLERLGGSYVHRDALVAECCDERDVLLRRRLNGVSKEKSHEVIVITDTIPVKKKRQAIERR